MIIELELKRLLALGLFFGSLLFVQWSFGAPVEVFKSGYISSVEEGQEYSRFSSFGKLEAGEYELKIFNTANLFENDSVNVFIDGVGGDSNNPFEVAKADLNETVFTFHLDEGQYSLSLFATKQDGFAFGAVSVLFTQLSLDHGGGSPVPVPGAMFLALSGLMALLGLRKRNKTLV